MDEVHGTSGLEMIKKSESGSSIAVTEDMNADTNEASPASNETMPELSSAVAIHISEDTTNNANDMPVLEALREVSDLPEPKKRLTKYKLLPLSSGKPKVHGKSDKALDDQPESPTAQPSNINLIIERSNNMCDRWDRLGLGKESGTAALNEYLQRVDGSGKHGDGYTAAQLLQMFDTLRPRMKHLPLKSEIRNMVQKSGFGEGYTVRQDRIPVDDEEDEDDETNEAQNKSLMPAETLAKVYEIMSTQSNYLNMKRRKIHHLDGDQVIDRLKSYENRVCELKKKEEEVMKQAIELGLVDDASCLL